MKKVIFLGLLTALLIGSCAQRKKSPIEGAWKLVSGQWHSIEKTFPAQIKGEQIKVFTKEHFTFVGQFNLDTVWQANYGWGTYTLDGNKFEEHVVIHAEKASAGTTKRMILEIRNDTLTQSWPTDGNWTLEEKFNTEKYIRLE